MSENLHRTQISLTIRQYQYLRRLAAQTGRSMSSIIREWVDENIGTQVPQPLDQDPFFEIIGMVAGDGTSVAREHDRYLYGSLQQKRP
ncbi:MAG: hypothetical protein WBH57_06185 [Anaerolineae bacterium]